MPPNIYRLKPYKDQMLRAAAMWLRERRISANLITTAGLLSGLGAAACFLMRHNGWGLLLLGASIAADLLDGAVARLGGGNKLSGKLYDAICDRVVELGWIGAFIGSGRLDGWALSLGVGSVILLACRFWAHQRGLDSTAVLVTRFERVAAVLAVIILPWRVPALAIYYLVTAGAFVSSLQIIGMIRNAAPGGGRIRKRKIDFVKDA